MIKVFQNFSLFSKYHLSGAQKVSNRIIVGIMNTQMICHINPSGGPIQDSYNNWKDKLSMIVYL